MGEYKGSRPAKTELTHADEVALTHEVISRSTRQQLLENTRQRGKKVSESGDQDDAFHLDDYEKFDPPFTLGQIISEEAEDFAGSHNWHFVLETRDAPVWRIGRKQRGGENMLGLAQEVTVAAVRNGNGRGFLTFTPYAFGWHVCPTLEYYATPAALIIKGVKKLSFSFLIGTHESHVREAIRECLREAAQTALLYRESDLELISQKTAGEVQ